MCIYIKTKDISIYGYTKQINVTNKQQTNNIYIYIYIYLYLNKDEYIDIRIYETM